MSAESVDLLNTTINGNTANSGAQVLVDATGGSATVNLKNTIVFGAGANDCSVSNGGVVSSQGNNLADASTCGLSSATQDRVGLDPRLGTLANNGGQTLTEAIDHSSPAADGADPAACPSTDQRGVVRVTSGDPVCDIGAFEAPVVASPALPRTGARTGAGGSPTVVALVVVTAVSALLGALARGAHRRPGRF